MAKRKAPAPAAKAAPAKGRPIKAEAARAALTLPYRGNVRGSGEGRIAAALSAFRVC